jgi:hypothetical protein
VKRKFSAAAIEHNRQWHRDNRERLKGVRKARYLRDTAKCAKIARNSALKANYGITLAEYQVLVSKQSGRCLICGKKPKRTLDVDHCHKTKVVRGLLCNQCNMAIGLLQDSVKLLRKAVKYLGG